MERISSNCTKISNNQSRAAGQYCCTVRTKWFSYLGINGVFKAYLPFVPFSLSFTTQLEQNGHKGNIKCRGTGGYASTTLREDLGRFRVHEVKRKF